MAKQQNESNPNQTKKRQKQSKKQQRYEKQQRISRSKRPESYVRELPKINQSWSLPNMWERLVKLSNQRILGKTPTFSVRFIKKIFFGIIRQNYKPEKDNLYGTKKLTYLQPYH